jgi:predicted metal-binding membrane protein
MKKSYFSIDKKNQVAILFVVGILTVFAWLYTAYSNMRDMDDMMADMTVSATAMDVNMDRYLLNVVAEPNFPGFGMFVPMWIVMCVGMMLPTVVPAVLCMSRICERRKKSGSAYASPWFFILGYIILWSVFGVICWGIAYLIFHFIANWLLDEQCLQLTTGGVFILAGIYQLCSFKNACLKGCQHPITFIMHNWKEGNFGALEMGMKHGLWCIGCCAALMLVIFPLGMMNLVWMSIFTLIMFAEKNARFGTILSKIVVWILLTAGIIITMLGIYYYFLWR